MSNSLIYYQLANYALEIVVIFNNKDRICQSQDLFDNAKFFKTLMECFKIGLENECVNQGIKISVIELTD